jgi:hypothetical protein
MRVFIYLVLTVILFTNCSNNSIEFEVDCENNISVNKEVLNLNQIEELVRNHKLKYKTHSEFKVKACSETKVSTIVELRKIIKSFSDNKDE